MPASPSSPRAPGTAPGPGRCATREHLWFELHGIDGDELDATLVNRPFKADVRMNERAMRPLELLTDWVITTPAGQITPRSDVTSRRLREHADELREAMRKAKR
jgi:hypothetical protein